ncbi:alpha-L-fucosidase [Sphingobacterium sp.]|uniref:alpha-L-fucosidase n=1 Tax=Sphingobacterium sp. TaxID=341027 RepID=UPI0031CDD002
MQKYILMINFFLLGFLCEAQQKEVVPSPAHVAWAEAEIGVIFHFDVVNYVPNYKWQQWGSHPPASVFNPSKLDTDQWIRAAKAAGAKYAVLVAKHCSGFSLWPTKAHDYNISKSSWKDGKGDIVKDFIQSCQKYGIKPGIYASASANGYLHVNNPGKVQPGGPLTQQQYNEVVTTQLSELWSNYGKLFEIWFDGGVLPIKDGGPDIAPLLKKLQPDAVVFQGPSDAKNLIRWIGNEEGRAPYPNWSRSDFTTSATGTIVIDGLNGDPNGSIWCPGEADFPMRTGWQGGWFWKENEQRLLSVDQLVDAYYTSVGRNSNMLLGIVVDTSGLVPKEDADRLAEFGKELSKATSHPIASIKNKAEKEFTLELKTQAVNQVIFAEMIQKGERIRKYRIDAWIDNHWIEIASGESVGNKRIHKFKEIKTSKIRLNIIESTGTPLIKSFAVYNI